MAREFKIMCKDTVTGMQMILSECSYNTACYWLENKGFTEYDQFESHGNEVWMYFSQPTKRLFIYDEDRGYLLGSTY